MNDKEYRRQQNKHRKAEIALQTAIQTGVSIREVIRISLPRLSLNQLTSIKYLLERLITAKAWEEKPPCEI